MVTAEYSDALCLRKCDETSLARVLSERVGGEESRNRLSAHKAPCGLDCRSSELRGSYKARVAANRILSFTAFRPRRGRGHGNRRGRDRRRAVMVMRHSIRTRQQ